MQREWWYHRIGCGLWFVAERDTRTNAVVKVEVPEPAATPVRLASRPGERIDRSREIDFEFDGRLVTGYEGDTIGSALLPQARACSRGASSTTARGGFSAAPATARTA